jgi:hypothetical protein
MMIETDGTLEPELSDFRHVVLIDRVCDLHGDSGRPVQSRYNFSEKQM